MGLFHKTIQDAEHAFQHDDWKKGMEIISHHVDHHHHLDGNLSKLSRAISRYQDMLNKINLLAGGQFTPEGWQKDKKEILTYVHELKHALNEIKAALDFLGNEEIKMK